MSRHGNFKMVHVQCPTQVQPATMRNDGSEQITQFSSFLWLSFSFGKSSYLFFRLILLFPISQILYIFISLNSFSVDVNHLAEIRSF